MKQGEPRSYRRTLVVAAALSLSLVLAACTGGQDPDGNGSPTPTEPATTTSAPASPTPPQMEPPERPAAMDDDGVEGAEAAARYFLELYPYVYTSGDLADWLTMSHSDCAFCASVVSGVEEQVADGVSFTGGEVSILEVSSEEPVEGNDFYRVNVLASEGRSERTDQNGKTVTTSGGTNLLIFAIGRQQQQWIVREVQIEEQEHAR